MLALLALLPFTMMLRFGGLPLPPRWLIFVMFFFAENNEKCLELPEIDQKMFQILGPLPPPRHLCFRNYNTNLTVNSWFCNFIPILLFNTSNKQYWICDTKQTAHCMWWWWCGEAVVLGSWNFRFLWVDLEEPNVTLWLAERLDWIVPGGIWHCYPLRWC